MLSTLHNMVYYTLFVIFFIRFICCMAVYLLVLSVLHYIKTIVYTLPDELINILYPIYTESSE